MGQQIVNYEKGELYETLVDEHEVFEYYYDVLVFLAVIGYRENRVKRSNYKGSSQAGTKGEAGLKNIYSRELYRTVLACLAFQDSGNPEDLVDSGKHSRVLAQYAAGGLECAEENFGDVAGDPTDAVLNYIEQVDKKSVEGKDEILRDIVVSFDDEMMDLPQD